MKVKFVKIPLGERIVKDGKDIYVEEVIDLPEESAAYFIERGIAEKVAKENETPKGKKD